VVQFISFILLFCLFCFVAQGELLQVEHKKKGMHANPRAGEPGQPQWLEGDDQHPARTPQKRGAPSPIQG
jgi:hypothetical protein